MSVYAVIDLEMCTIPKGCRKKGSRLAKETIQIGAVLLNEEYEITQQFSTYVFPEMGYIDSFIENLTGIDHADVKNAPRMPQAWAKFMEWLPEGAIMVSWSNTDSAQIRREAETKDFLDAIPDGMFEQWIDAQKLFSGRIERERIYSLEEALIAADILQEGRAHDGLTDAYNTALLFAKLQKEPEFRLNPIYEYARAEKKDTLSFGLKSLLAGIQIAEES